MFQLQNLAGTDQSSVTLKIPVEDFQPSLGPFCQGDAVPCFFLLSPSPPLFLYNQLFYHHHHFVPVLLFLLLVSLMLLSKVKAHRSDWSRSLFMNVFVKKNI